MVALLRLLDAVQVRVELFLLEERRAVDALQHLALLVAAPVGAGRVQQLEVLEARRVRHVRAAAQVDERPVGVGRDDLVVAELGEALELERIVGETLLRFARDRPPRARTETSPPTTLRISSSNRARSSGVNGCVDLEVVVEAVVDRGTEADLRVGAQAAHRGREDVRAEWRSTSSARGSCSVSTRNAPPVRSGVMRSWISPSTSTAIAACSSRSPIERTTSRASVPAGTSRVGAVGQREGEHVRRPASSSFVMIVCRLTEASREAASGAARTISAAATPTTSDEHDGSPRREHRPARRASGSAVIGSQFHDAQVIVRQDPTPQDRMRRRHAQPFARTNVRTLSLMAAGAVAGAAAGLFWANGIAAWTRSSRTCGGVRGLPSTSGRRGASARRPGAAESRRRRRVRRRRGRRAR